MGVTTIIRKEEANLFLSIYYDSIDNIMERLISETSVFTISGVIFEALAHELWSVVESIPKGLMNTT